MPKHPEFVLAPLTTQVAPLDYAAYMASPDVIRTHSDGRWPTEGFTKTENLTLVEQHQADHDSGRAFTYTVLNPLRDQGLGCVYINPVREYLRRNDAPEVYINTFPNASAMITFWVRQDLQNTTLPTELAATLHAWLRDAWPLERYLFRLLPTETTTLIALERLPLRQMVLTLSSESRPYLWFAPEGADDSATTPSAKPIATFLDSAP